MMRLSPQRSISRAWRARLPLDYCLSWMSLFIPIYPHGARIIAAGAGCGMLV